MSTATLDLPIILGTYRVTVREGARCSVALHEFGSAHELFEGSSAETAAWLEARAGVTERASVLEARILGARYGHPAQDVLPGYREVPSDPEERFYALHDGWVS